MARYATPGELKAGDWFVDPHREGRRPAVVVKVLKSDQGKVNFELNDDTKWGAWTASYEADEQLELA